MPELTLEQMEREGVGQLLRGEVPVRSKVELHLRVPLLGGVPRRRGSRRAAEGCDDAALLFPGTLASPLW